MKVLIAGVGVLGKNLIDLYLARGDEVRALAYAEREFAGLGHPRLETVVCDVTRPETLQNVCRGVDYMISCIGITRQKGRLTHMGVDYQGNVNLLREAETAEVRKFGFISPEGVDRDGYEKVPLLAAKQKFEEELKSSSIEWVIFRAGGFFPDLLEMGNQAKKGMMFVIGGGNNRFTPVDIRDLASTMAEKMDVCLCETLSVGGPEDLSWNDVCRICFEYAGKKPRIFSVPERFCAFMLRLIQPFDSAAYAMGQLILFMSCSDHLSQKTGRRRFADYVNESL